MGLSFLAPAFFAALAALAIPILVHLTHRSRREVVRFPSLRFLDQVPYRAVRRQRIRHWALFLARCLALVLLALAFARPLLDRVGRAGGAGTGGTETVLLLDRSYSMGYGDHWQRAVAAARAVTDAIGPEDRASIVTFGEDASLSVEGTSDPTLLRLALDSLTPGAGRTRFAPALQVARQILDQSRLPNRDVVLISDFQDQGWERSTDVSLPPGAAFRTVDLSVTEPINVLLSNARIQRGERGGREEVFVLARVVNQGDAPVRGLPVDLEVDGTPVNRQVASVEPRSAATVRFGPIAQPSAVARATVRSAVDSLPLDNAFHFVLPPRPTISILIVEGAGRGSRSALYLRQALRISHEPAFLVESKRANQLRPGDLSGRAIVILNDCPFPSGAAGQALIEFVRDGGGLLTVLGSKSAMSSWPAEARDLLPGTWGAPVDRLSDGSVAAAERMFGKGKTLLWTSALDNLWNDFPIQPVYLPLIHQMARHLSGRRVDPPFFGAGQILDLSNYADRLGAGDEAAPLEIVVETPSGERVSKSTGGEDRFLLLDEPGFYAIRPAGRRITAYPIAVNADRAESDLNALDPEEFSAAVTASVDTEEREAIALAALTPEERERRQGLWWYMLVIALVVLVAESIASNRLPFIARTERPQEASRG
jgi:hypothetical protein